MTFIKGKRILFLAPKFFGYELDILQEMQRRGAEIDYLRDRPFDSASMIAVTRFARSAVLSKVDRYYQSELKKFGRSAYDFVFVVNGQTFSAAFLQDLKKQFATATFVLYMWDSIANRRSVVANLNSFDRALTFDRTDAEHFQMSFRPLFYAKGFEAPAAQEHEYDISFIGTAHSDRAKIVADIDGNLSLSTTRFWFLYLQAKWVYVAYKLTNSSFHSAKFTDFSFKPLPKEKVQSVLANTRTVLDIEHPKQIGLTMRTFETLGASKKLVTTNSEVRSYDFYCPENVLIIDRKNAIIPTSFLRTPFAPIATQIRYKYSLSGWLDDVLG